jgi:hypothetical protein
VSTKVFKMINGEEIIGDVTAGSDVGYFLENPATIMVQQNEQGQVGVGLAPYMPYVEGKVYIYKTAIASEGEPEPKMAKEYNRIFGSGIEVVPASALAGLKVVS